jgi:hypothetical protein
MMTYGTFCPGWLTVIAGIFPDYGYIVLPQVYEFKCMTFVFVVLAGICTGYW